METCGYFPRYLAIVRENEAERKQKFSPSLVFLLIIQFFSEHKPAHLTPRVFWQF